MNKKRPLPIQQKELVYNEWGAIIQHQDEMDKALKAQDLHRQKDFASRYRADLDGQRAEVARKLAEDKAQDAHLAVGMLEYQRVKDEQKALADDAKRIQLRDQVI